MEVGAYYYAILYVYKVPVFSVCELDPSRVAASSPGGRSLLEVFAPPLGLLAPAARRKLIPD